MSTNEDNSTSGSPALVVVRSDSVLLMVKAWRQRSQLLKRNANWVLILILGSLIAGLTLFVYAGQITSRDIGAFHTSLMDAEQKRIDAEAQFNEARSKAVQAQESARRSEEDAKIAKESATAAGVEAKDAADKAKEASVVRGV